MMELDDAISTGRAAPSAWQAASAVTFALLCVFPPISASAQAAIPPVTTAVVDSVGETNPVTLDVSGQGAFLRSLVVPGWGHAHLGEHSRGAFYVMVDGGIALLFLKTRSRLESARTLVERREGSARRRLEAEGVTDPTELDVGVATDVAVLDAQGLVESRESQREDWVALGIFFLLIGGVDAYVSAHLHDFPVPLGVAAGAAGGVEISFSVPIFSR